MVSATQITNVLLGRKSVVFNPERDIPSLASKVILVTGANIGLGKQCVLEYARHKPHQIWLASRSLEKAKVAAEEIKQQVPGAPIKLLELDLSSFESVRKAANVFLSESNRLDILILNAGIMANPAGLTEDGYEIHFGTNYMGHALLVKLLLPVLQKTVESSTDCDVRMVSVSSHGHTFWQKGGFQFETLKSATENLGPYQQYYRSKLANVLWVRQLAKLYPQFTVVAVCPGTVQTNIMSTATGTPLLMRAALKLGRRFLSTVEEGAKNQLWASVSRDVKSGEYYESVGVGYLASADGKDDQLAKEVWDWTEREFEAGAYA